MLLNHLYSGMDEPELKIIDVLICKLRKKLADDRAAKTTLRRFGVVAMWCAISLTKKRSKYPFEVSEFRALGVSYMGAAQETFERD